MVVIKLNQPNSHVLLLSLAILIPCRSQTAIAQLGLVLRFHRDVKALGVESYAAKAPGSITRPLTHAIKEYNDACDTMEAELVRSTL
jgi:hypothetical protein